MPGSRRARSPAPGATELYRRRACGRSSTAAISISACSRALREMKALIENEVARRELADHVKLGPGGIREIEFIVQAFQLIRGGRTGACRRHRCWRCCRSSRAPSCCRARGVRSSRRPIVFLRRLENRLQMLADAQTHTLPADERAARAHRAGDGFRGLGSLRGRARCRIARASRALSRKSCLRAARRPPRDAADRRRASRRCGPTSHRRAAGGGARRRAASPSRPAAARMLLEFARVRVLSGGSMRRAGAARDAAAADLRGHRAIADASGARRLDVLTRHASGASRPSARARRTSRCSTKMPRRASGWSSSPPRRVPRGADRLASAAARRIAR